MKYSETSIPRTNPIHWLHAQTLYPKVYWKEKGSQTLYAAIGKSQSFDQPYELEGRVYGGTSFHKSHSDHTTWQEFPHTAYWLPEVELCCSPEGCTLRYYTTPFETAAPTPPGSTTALSPAHYTPNYEEWKSLVENNPLQKLVLARKTTSTTRKKACPFAYLQRIPHLDTSTIFLFQLTPDTAFLGATPELLFKKEKDKLTTEAVAGTRARGHTPDEDADLANELLSSSKDRHEFNLVKEELACKLSPLTTEGGWVGEDTLLKSSHVQHLYDRFEASLEKPLSCQELINILHPTPALGGVPQHLAQKKLQEVEQFNRGWYGAPIGIASKERSAFYVAIRSALFSHDKIHLFSGAGIVNGSIAEKEWAELNAKLSWFRSLQEAVHKSHV